MNNPIHPKIIPTMLAIAAAFLVGSLAATGDATAKVSGAGKAEQSNLVLQAQQFQPRSEPLVPVDSSFTYQGRLKDGPNPANGQYDFEFKLFDALIFGTQIGQTITRANQTVSEGLVTVSLDFGLTAFQGQARYLLVAVRPAGGGNFTTLSPRQAVSPAPYAMGLRPGTVITDTSSSVQFVNNGAVRARSSTGPAIRAESTAFNSAGVVGIADFGDNAAGVVGFSNLGGGVRGYSFGDSPQSAGVYGISSDGIGVYGISTFGIAGYFAGDVDVTGNLSKGGGSFKIDHPLDPANKYLYHSFVESPDMMNIYNGNATTDAKGEAVVVLPDYFEALNKDFRYQLTVMGQFAQAIVASEINANRFTIRTDKPNVKVSWQVTGIRKDAYAEANRIPVEEDKGKDRGKYLHPEEHGQPESKGIDYEESQKMQEMQEKHQTPARP